MSLIIVGVPVLECVYMLACARWVWKRCVHTGTRDSERWGTASIEDFEPIPRICRFVLAVYEEDLANPKWPPEGGYGMDPSCVVKRTGYSDTLGRVPPYLLYLDHPGKDIVLAIRGLNLGNEHDYAVLLNNRLGQEMFDGGYVHHGLLKSAAWLLNREANTLTELILAYPSYTLTFAGHSLGSGVASMLTIIVANHTDKLGSISRERLRCYAIAPARCMSLNLAVRYADLIKSVVLQDDFLPRTATPLEDIFKSIFCLPCLLCMRCMRDTCISEERMLHDPRRLYAPGRLYHIVERKLCRMGKFPPVVKTAIPVDGRFEHVVLSCNATSDHSIVWIEREARKALEIMAKDNAAMHVPASQKMQRQETLREDQMEEHKAALERAETLKVPHASSCSSPSYGTFDSFKPEHEYEYEYEDSDQLLPESNDGFSSISGGGSKGKKTNARTNWEALVDKLFERDGSGKVVIKKKSATLD